MHVCMDEPFPPDTTSVSLNQLPIQIQIQRLLLVLAQLTPFNLSTRKTLILQ
jgi:hypothetical protein